MTEKTLTTENIRPALDALRGELAPWPVVAKKQDRLNTAQLNAANSGITSSLVAQIIANTAAIRALESAITGTGLRALVVASLPAVGTTGILYIVPVTTYDPETDADVVNYSNEYIWIPVEGGQASEGHYEQVGQTGIVINNGQLTITVNGTSVGTFTANQSGDTTAAITVPTNADYVDRTTDQTVAGKKTWTGEQSFTLPIVGSITGTASKAIADEDGTSIKTGYGKLANVNTWANVQNYKSPIRFTNDSYASGTPSENIFYATVQWGGYVNNTWSAPFTINNAVRTNGYNDTAFRTYSQTSNTLTGFVHETNADASDIAFRPITNGTHKLGSSSYQWSSVYAQTYYYNGTAWGLDKTNVWTENNRFSKNSALSDITSYTDTSMSFTGNSNTIFFNTRGSSNYPSFGTFLFAGYASGTAPDRYGQLKLVRSTDIKGGTYDGYKPDSSFNLWRVAPHYSLMDFVDAVRVQNDGTNNYIAPITTNATDLGTSANKWKTLNGINPGALSLPSSSYVDISGDITIRDGSAPNFLTASCDGWIAINSFATWLQISDDTTLMATTANPGADGFAQAILPVRQGDSIRITINQTNTLFQSFRLIPCLGNV